MDIIREDSPGWIVLSCVFAIDDVVVIVAMMRVECLEMIESDGYSIVIPDFEMAPEIVDELGISSLIHAKTDHEIVSGQL